MNMLTFPYQGNVVRTVMKDGEPWFVARDVCEVLEISDARQAVERLDDDERCLIPVTDSLGREQQTFAVSEPGLYSLILGSRKPEAKVFKRWITHEVLPAIRKTGSYSSPKPDERQLRIELFKSALEHEERLGSIEQRIEQVERKVTLDYAEQRLVQQTVGRRVREFASGDDRRELYSQLYREIKDRWGVGSYKDVKRIELQQVIQYINAWRPKLLLAVE